MTAETETFEAYVEHANGDRQVWGGLTYGQARWRYNWLRRQALNNPAAVDWDAFGFQEEI